MKCEALRNEARTYSTIHDKKGRVWWRASQLSLMVGALSWMLLLMVGCSPYLKVLGSTQEQAVSGAGSPTAAGARAAAAVSSLPLRGYLNLVSWFADGPMPCSYGSGAYPSLDARSVTLHYGGPHFFRPEAAAMPVIQWVKCGDAIATNLNITPTSPTHTLIINQWPKRALNILLYSGLPSAPNGNFSWMQALIAMGFAVNHPDVFLNVVVSQDEVYDIYAPENLSRLYGSRGFDIVELDTIMLGEVISEGWIRPVNYDVERFWPVAVANTEYRGRLYGVPSWLCSDYIYSRDPEIKELRSLPRLLSYLRRLPKQVPSLVSDFNGRWRLIGLYLNAYAAIYGHENLSRGMGLPLDPATLDAVSALTSACRFGGSNNCINGRYHEGQVNELSDVFAIGAASTYVGFSEQSFYILSGQANVAPLYAAPIPYGDRIQPLMYLDAFTLNAVTCADGTACDASATAFIEYMNTSMTRTMISYSWDLNGSFQPPRHMLPAITSFYDQPLVRGDPLYVQYTQALAISGAFPNTISSRLKVQLYHSICVGLKTRDALYKC